MARVPESPPLAAPPRRTALAVALILLAFASGVLATYAYRAFPRPLEHDTETTLRDTPAVLAAVRDLAVLESASFHMERIIDLRDRQSHLFGLFESQDALLLVAAADVVAGIDLSSMRDGDIRFDRAHNSVSILLPPPTVLSARLDNEHTYVHARSTDRLALRAESLETRARREAERTLREAALEAGILERARANAARTLRTLITSLGYDQVEITFRAE